jgi:hypothetical protein
MLISADLRSKARELPGGGELCWNWKDIKEVLRELAASSRLILGFDIFTFPPQDDGTVFHRGVSGYSVDAEIKSRSWREVVALSLQLALRDLGRTAELSYISGPLDEVWYSVTTMRKGENPLKEFLEQ